MTRALAVGVAATALLAAAPALAQHAGHGQAHAAPPPAAQTAPADPHAGHAGHAAPADPAAAPDPHAAHRTAPRTDDPHAGHAGHAAGATAAHGGMAMGGMFGPWAMEREASGTAWQPEGGAEPMVLMRHDGDWMWMGHALLNGVYTDQGGRRGDSQAFASGMVMLMGQRPLAGGTFGLRGMASIDPFMGPRGYPLLLAAGETADGRHPLIDRQHPHELISELAATYSRPLGRDASWFAYVAPVGEPAFGPPAFPHRNSGMDNPLAPISHHWLDSTHISFGVLTGGVAVGRLKLEASGFRGREPDEDRYDIEAPRLDSWTVRATWNPTPDWSFQVSRAEQSSPEQLEPDEDVTRTSASAAWGRRLDAWGGVRANALVAWGRRTPSHGDSLDAAIAEGSLAFDSGWTAFARAERIETNELVLGAHTPGGGHAHGGPAYRVGQLTVGGLYDWTVRPGVRVGVGGAFQAYQVPAALEPLYGGDPTSVTAFVRLRAQ